MWRLAECRTHKILILICQSIFILLLIACQKKPSIAISAEPTAMLAARPMGSDVTNLQLKKDLAQLEQKLDPKADPAEKNMRYGQFYFERRRFIEAATHLSKTLDQNSLYPGARNLLARCFFFLGNPDRSIEELEFVLKSNSTDAEKVDALFVLGASVRDNPSSSLSALKKGVGAWETYSKLAPNSEYALEVKRGIAELKGRINNGALSNRVGKNPRLGP
jgi:tetratricopeptide (TPR) repeat protein